MYFLYDFTVPIACILNHLICALDTYLKITYLLTYCLPFV